MPAPLRPPQGEAAGDEGQEQADRYDAKPHQANGHHQLGWNLNQVDG
jgi:hypothetical protein